MRREFAAASGSCAPQDVDLSHNEREHPVVMWQPHEACADVSDLAHVGTKARWRLRGMKMLGLFKWQTTFSSAR